MAGPQTQAAGPTAGLDEASAVKGMVGTRGRGASGAGTGSAAAGLTGDSCPRPRSAQSRAGGGDRGPLPPARPMNPHGGQRRPPRRRVSARRGPRRQGLTCRSAREIPTVSKNCSTKDTRAPSTAGLLGPRGSWTGRREGSLGAGPPRGGARAPAGSLGCRPQGRGLSIPLGAEPQGGDGGGSGWRRGAQGQVGSPRGFLPHLTSQTRIPQVHAATGASHAPVSTHQAFLWPPDPWHCHQLWEMGRLGLARRRLLHPPNQHRVWGATSAAAFSSLFP